MPAPDRLSGCSRPMHVSDLPLQVFTKARVGQLAPQYTCEHILVDHARPSLSGSAWQRCWHCLEVGDKGRGEDPGKHSRWFSWMVRAAEML